MKIKFKANDFVSLYSKSGSTVAIALHACNCCRGCKAGKC